MDTRMSSNGRPEWRRSDKVANQLLAKLPEEHTGVTSEQDAINYAVAWFMLSFHPPWETDER